MNNECVVAQEDVLPCKSIFDLDSKPSHCFFARIGCYYSGLGISGYQHSRAYSRSGFLLNAIQHTQTLKTRCSRRARRRNRVNNQENATAVDTYGLAQHADHTETCMFYALGMFTDVELPSSKAAPFSFRLQRKQPVKNVRPSGPAPKSRPGSAGVLLVSNVVLNIYIKVYIQEGLRRTELVYIYIYIFQSIYTRGASPDRAGTRLRLRVCP